MAKISTNWYKQYRPTTIDKYFFQSEFDKGRFLKYIADRDIPDLILHGHRGTGKTTLALILKHELNICDIDFLHLNASDDNSVGVIRDVVGSFIDTMSMGKFKIVFLDEADALTVQAQWALKAMIEDDSNNARFILACNNAGKLIPEISDSRCTVYKFNAVDRQSMKAVGVEILLKQGLDTTDIDRDELNAMLEAHIDVGYPDLRKFINSIENHFADGKLIHPHQNSYNMELLVEILMCVEDGNWMRARDIIYESLPAADISSVYSFIDQHLSTVTDDTELLGKGYSILGLYAYRDDTIAVPELNLTVCIIKLCQTLGVTK